MAVLKFSVFPDPLAAFLICWMSYPEFWITHTIDKKGIQGLQESRLLHEHDLPEAREARVRGPSGVRVDKRPGTAAHLKPRRALKT